MFRSCDIIWLQFASSLTTNSTRTTEGIEEAPWIDVGGLTPRRREESQRGYP
jgi:hypothetical protein